MRLTQKISALVLGGVVVLGMAGAAVAAPAVATGSVNVRSGPSTQYQAVDTLQRNQLVEVTGCRGGWCYVEKRGADGWVSSRYLRAANTYAQRPNRPSVNFSINFGNAPVVRPPRHHEQHWGPGRGGHDRGGHDRGGRNNSGFSFQYGY